jgi:hypothetical protein
VQAIEAHLDLDGFFIHSDAALRFRQHIKRFASRLICFRLSDFVRPSISQALASDASRRDLRAHQIIHAKRRTIAE